MTRIEKRRVGRRKWPAAVSSGLRRHAVGEADRTACPVVTAGTQAARRRSQIAIDHDGVVKPELCQVETGFLLIGASKPNEVVDHLGDTDRGQGTTVVDELFDVAGRGFVLQERQHRIGIEDGQRRVARSASCRRASRRARVVDGPCFAYLPRKSPTGSSPTGRMTTRSPRSTTSTCRVFHRARVSAGIDTWPFRDTVITCEVSTMTALYGARAALYTTVR
jgi:hypothetical protein